MGAESRAPKICFVGLNNLRVLAPELSGGFAGGAELQQVLLARALVARGFDVSMVTLDLGQPDGASWGGIRVYKTFRWEVGVPILRFFHPRLSSVWRAMRRADADVYYFSCADVLLGVVAAFARYHGRRSIFRIACDADCHPDTLEIRLSRDKWFYRYGLARVDLVLAQTAHQRELMARHFGRDSRVIPSLVDVQPKRLPVTDRDIDVLWVAQLRPRKRPELLLELARRHPQLRFTMVGGHAEGTPPGWFESVRDAAASVPNVRFCGFVPINQMPGYFERARLLVNTSTTEGFSNTYLQAWAHGTPTIAFHDPDQLIARHGLGYAAKELEDMSHAIASLSEDDAAWTAVSERCIGYFDRHYAGARSVGLFVDAINELLHRQPRTEPAAQRARTGSGVE
jgi:glycosyltransferase involved in cell wall biosynthesis